MTYLYDTTPVIYMIYIDMSCYTLFVICFGIEISRFGP